jgi:hypothetical protein
MTLMSGLKPWPIVAGILIDIVGSVILGLLYVLIIVGMPMARGTPPGDPIATPDYIVIEVLGLLLTAVGGFAAARMAKTLHVQHGLAVGIGALCVWIVIGWGSTSEWLPSWYEAASFAGLLAAGAAGGYVATRKRSTT